MRFTTCGSLQQHWACLQRCSCTWWTPLSGSRTFGSSTTAQNKLCSHIQFVRPERDDNHDKPLS